MNFTKDLALQLAFLACGVAHKNLRQLAWENGHNENDYDFMFSDSPKAWSLRWDAVKKTIEDITNPDVVNLLKIPADVINEQFLSALIKLATRPGGITNNWTRDGLGASARVLTLDTFIRLMEDEEEPMGLANRRFEAKLIDNIWSVGRACFDREWETLYIDRASLHFMQVWSHAFDEPEKVYNELFPNNGIHPFEDDPRSTTDICEMQGIGHIVALRVLPADVRVQWLSSDSHGQSFKEKIQFSEFISHLTIDEGGRAGLMSLGFPVVDGVMTDTLLKHFGSMITGGISEGEYELIIDLAHDIAVCLAEYNEEYILRSTMTYHDFVLYDNGVFAELKSKYAIAVKSIIWGKAFRLFETSRHGECDFSYVRACYLIRQLGTAILDEMVEKKLLDMHHSSTGSL